MDRPQQPELERSGRTPVDQDYRDDLGPAVTPPTKDDPSRIPPGNRPGHHPALEQDKPVWAGGAPPDGDGEGASKADLYRAAQRLGIAGRSRMTKRELAAAIASHRG